MKKITMLLILSIILGFVLKAQNDGGYKFETIINLPATPVENQYSSGTCWSFSGLSFLESEMIRMGKEPVDMAEMFVVYQSYLKKAEKYIRMHGEINFGTGGSFFDVFNVISNQGMVPENVYTGNVIGEELPRHGEMHEVLDAYVKAVLKNPNKKLTPVWQKGFKTVLDAYLGDMPNKFNYNGKSYDPKSFAQEIIGINPADYVAIGSYTHHPFYSKFIIEIPDNWAWGYIYNLPLDEFMQIFDYALENGYTIAWGADVSEKGFSWRNGVAVIPEDEIENLEGLEREKWEKMDTKEKTEYLYSFEKPVQEKKITQEIRQEAFDNYLTQDDHGMHITGIAKDQMGTKYYVVKNSWGDKHTIYDGYFYASETYVKYKTINIVVHKDAVPDNLAKKLGL